MLALAALLAGLVMAAGAVGAVGGLAQKAGTGGCVSETGTGGICVDGKALNGSFSVAISPDGTSAYVGGYEGDSIAVFDRNPTTGLLTQKAGTAGCVSETGSGGTCVDGKALDGVGSLTVSPGGTQLYAGSTVSDAVAIFDRNTTTGALTQKAGTAGCVSDTGSGGACVDGKALNGAFSVAVSPNGASVYVGSTSSDAVAVFDRNTTSGVLTQKTGTAGCISETGSSGTCADGKALDGASGLAVSANGASLYAASSVSDAVAVFDRNTTTGGLTQKAGTAGCVSETGTSGACVDGKALDGAFMPVISADGTSVYATATTSDAVSVFDRNTTTGALTQKAGTAGCVSETGTSGACADGRGLDSPYSLAISADGASVYIASLISSTVAIFERTTAGALSQPLGTAGCVSETGTVTGGTCVDGKALEHVAGVAIAPDDGSVLAAAYTADAVSVFDRDVAPQTTIDSGPNGPTGDNTPTFTFSSSDAGSTFECRIDGGSFSPCSGFGTHTTSTLADGTHTFEVRAIDPSANPDASPASRSFTVDTAGPQTSILSGPAGPTNDPTPSFSFSASEAGSTFECRVDSDAFAPCSGPGATHTTAGLSDGAHTFEVRAIDPVGIPDSTPATRSFTVDTAPPQTTIDAGPDGPTNDTTPTFTFSSSDASSTFECRFDSDPFGPCSGPGTSHTTAALSAGAHTFEVRATDAAALTDPDPASRSFTIDLVAPQTTIDSGPSGPTGDPTPTFGFSSSEAASGFECRIDTGAFSPCSGPGDTHTSSSLSDGLHTFEVRATDPAGNLDATAASQTFTVDTAAPATAIDSGPAGLTNDASPTFQFSSDEAGSSFECRVDADPFGPCSGPGDTHTTLDLDDGAHSFEVRATDAVGNTDGSPVTRTFTVETSEPDTAIDAGPTGPTNDPTPTFEFSSNEPGSTFECRVDSESFGPCSGPGDSHTSATLTDGAHTFEVRATDPVGNTDPVPETASFSVDTDNPQTTVDLGPPATTTDVSPTFEFSSDEVGSSFECRIDSDSFGPCSGPGNTHTTADLGDGPHTFEVRATDAAGNVDPTPASRSFSVDTTPPPTTIDSGPNGPTGDATPTFGFSSGEAGASFQCRIDANPFGACSGPGSHTAGTLTDGAHSFEVRAIDAVGNVDQTPASRSFSVDTATPQTTIDAGPTGTINDVSPTFEFSSDEPGSSFECKVDSGSFGACSGPGDRHTTADLGDGVHTFEVRATDPAGNADATAASRTFTVETAEPETTIDSKPDDPTSDPTASFEFSSDEPDSSFECKIDGASFGACSGPGDSHTTAPLGDGVHTFEVRATDQLGNTDPTAADFSFTVDTAAPDTVIDSGPTGLINDASPTFLFSSDETGSSFECRVDSDPFGPCTGAGTHTTADLADGAHSFEVRAVDRAATPDPTPAVRDFRLDATGPELGFFRKLKKKRYTRFEKPTIRIPLKASEPVTYRCKVGKKAFAPCESPWHLKVKSKPGRGKRYSLSVIATDTAGNVSSALTARFRLIRKE